MKKSTIHPIIEPSIAKWKDILFKYGKTIRGRPMLKKTVSKQPLYSIYEFLVSMNCTRNANLTATYIKHKRSFHNLP